jgi:hypothetical protein
MLISPVFVTLHTKQGEGNRLVKFGKFAGYAGMIDMLHGLGDRLLARGFSETLYESSIDVVC